MAKKEQTAQEKAQSEFENAIAQGPDNVRVKTDEERAKEQGAQFSPDIDNPKDGNKRFVDGNRTD